LNVIHIGVAKIALYAVDRKIGKIQERVIIAERSALRHRRWSKLRRGLPIPRDNDSLAP